MKWRGRRFQESGPRTRGYGGTDQRLDRERGFLTGCRHPKGQGEEGVGAEGVESVFWGLEGRISRGSERSPDAPRVP